MKANPYDISRHLTISPNPPGASLHRLLQTTISFTIHTRIPCEDRL